MDRRLGAGGLAGSARLWQHCRTTTMVMHSVTAITPIAALASTKRGSAATHSEDGKVGEGNANDGGDSSGGGGGDVGGTEGYGGGGGVEGVAGAGRCAAGLNATGFGMGAGGSVGGGEGNLGCGR